MNDLYGRIMPASKKQLNEKTKEIKNQAKQIEGHIENQCAHIKNQINDFEKNVKDIHEEISICQDSINKRLDEKTKALEKRIDRIEVCMDELQKAIHVLDVRGRAILRASNEAVWSDVFHDAILESSWLNKKTFFPGRWAAGYPFLYALYRSLEEFHPKDILELGLGQTTRMIGQYAEYEKKCHHIVVEHDQEWIDTFKQGFLLSTNTEIIKLNIDKNSFYDTEPTTIYVDFAEKLQGRKFDLISIDAPFGGDSLVYARMDILGILPECLKPDFVIFVDDYNRHGEQHMVEKLKGVLEENCIPYRTGIYKGNKETYMITSESLKFLCTM